MRGCSEGGSSEDSVATRWRWACDDPLAGAPALDAHLTECERASAPIEKGTNEFWGAPMGVQNFLSVRV